MKLRRKNKVGLVIAGLLGLVDMANVVDLSSADDHPGPPVAILAMDAVLGLVTVAAVIYTFRTGTRAGSRIAAASRILSAFTAVPAFFVTGVPAPLVAAAATFVVLTVLCVALLLARPDPALETV